ALPAALGDAGAKDDAEPEPRPLMKRPIVVIPLFLTCVAAIVLAFAWPRKSADELYAAARPLLESENPDDWDPAVEQYRDQLSQKYQKQYTAEIEAARAKVRDRKELKRSLAEGAKLDPRSDAERAYLRGLRLAQAGDPNAARRLWQAVVAAFGQEASEARWVELSRAGLEALKRSENVAPHVPPNRAAFDAALARAKSL